MILSAFLFAYGLLWLLLTPVALIYIWRRARRDTRYGAHLAERFGRYGPLPQQPIWIHAVSLGETRSAVPLARALLAAGETVVFTHFTPAGRAEAEAAFAEDIARGRVASVWVPLDMHWCLHRFFRACRPKLGLTMEIEIWPAMIFAAKRAGVPLYMCNAQYPDRSLARDRRGMRLRQRVMGGVAGAFVKSQLQADRFASAGVPNIHITGELRFDQPIPPALLEAAASFAPRIAGRRVVTIASAIEGEDAVFIEAAKTLLAQDPDSLIIYVPRAPERFDAVAHLLEAADLAVARRSAVWGPGAAGLGRDADWPDTAQVLLGDSMGEMYFYLALASRVVVGGGFHPKGAHNVIEPLALQKPVVTGPYIHTIEYPFLEAEAAGVARRVSDGAELAATLIGPNWTDTDEMKAFFAAHAGATAKTMAVLRAELHA